MASKKQAVLIELLSQQKRNSENAAGLAVPQFYRRPGAVPARRFGGKDLREPPATSASGEFPASSASGQFPAAAASGQFPAASASGEFPAQMPYAQADDAGDPDELMGPGQPGDSAKPAEAGTPTGAAEAAAEAKSDSAVADASKSDSTVAATAETTAADALDDIPTAEPVGAAEDPAGLSRRSAEMPAVEPTRLPSRASEPARAPINLVMGGESSSSSSSVRAAMPRRTSSSGFYPPTAARPETTTRLVREPVATIVDESIEPPPPPLAERSRLAGVGEWFSSTWASMRTRLTPAPRTEPSPFESNLPPVGQIPDDVGAAAVRPEPTVLRTTPDGRVEISLSYPVAAIALLCLMILCAIFYQLGKGSGLRVGRTPMAAEPAEAQTQTQTPGRESIGIAAPPRPSPTRGEGEMQPAPARENGANAAAAEFGGGVSGSPDLASREAEAAADSPVREDGLHYLVLASVRDRPAEVAELEKAQKWLLERHGFETSLERVYKDHWSLVTVAGVADPSGREMTTLRSAVEAYGKEYAGVGRCRFRDPSPRRYPWGS